VTAERALFDRSASVRGVAQDHLRTRGVDVVGWYLERLSSGRGPATTDAALRGRFETGNEEHAVVIAPFASHPSARVRDVVCKALASWGAAAYKDVLFGLLSDASRRVVRRAGQALARAGLTSSEIDRLWASAIARTDGALRPAVASLGRWTQLLYALRAVESADASTASLGLAVFDDVMARWNESFTAPPPAVRAELVARAAAVGRLGNERAEILRASLRPFLPDPPA
jgi:HEAT repeats